jgi:gluconate kinase
MILLLNGAFGIGKTTVARALVPRLGRAVLFDPELIGIALQRFARVDDFQDLRAWRRLTIAGLRMTRMVYPTIIVPMAFSNTAYLDEIRAGIRRFEPRLHHVCLVAPLEVVHERLRRRQCRPDDAAWQLRRAAECCAVHSDARFGVHVDAGTRGVEEIVEEILARIEAAP